MSYGNPGFDSELNSVQVVSRGTAVSGYDNPCYNSAQSQASWSSKAATQESDAQDDSAFQEFSLAVSNYRETF